jgi:undecaprenyl-diphosphatase
MGVLEAILLGLLQGLTEFLPVSSSGHLALGQALLGEAGTEDLRFNILVHGATALSTIWVFRKDIGQLIVGVFRNGSLPALGPEETGIPARNFVGWLVVSAIPAAIVGLSLRDWFETHFVGQPARVGIMLMVTGVWLLLAQRFAQNGKPMGMRGAVLMGLAQAVAILPGISRSGATIGMGLLSGVPRAEAARFSFLMALPPVLGAMLLETLDLMEATSLPAGGESPGLVYAAGFIAAFFSGALACRWMIQLVRKLNLGYFAFYCLAAGLLASIFFR